MLIRPIHLLAVVLGMALVCPVLGVVPVTDFMANVTSGDAPLTVQFTDTSQNTPVMWVWNFGDGGVSFEQSPSHTYTLPGVYNVELSAANEDGSDNEVKTGYITVLLPPVAPVAAFTADVVAGGAPLTVSFTDLSTNTPTAWAWDFDGDAVADSVEQNPSHEYASEGTYNVTLQVTNDAGTDLETKIGYVIVGERTARLLRAGFSYTQPIGTAPFSVSFTDETVSNGSYTREWDFGDGTTSFDEAPVHEYATAGKYDVELVVSSDYVQDSSTARKAVMAYPAAAVSPLPTTTFGAHMTEIMESNWNVSVIGPIIPRAYTDALTPLAGNTGVGDYILWGIIWSGVFMILFVRQGTSWLVLLLGLVTGGGILKFLPPEFAHVGIACAAIACGGFLVVFILGRNRST